jgi:hypothetical protein
MKAAAVLNFVKPKPLGLLILILKMEGQDKKTPIRGAFFDI